MKPNILDRAISWIAPETGYRRLRQRSAIDILSRGYDGANKGRLSDSWRTQPTSADSELLAQGALLRDRMRDLVRNNPHAANALSVLVNHAIGAGIRPRAADPKVNALFEKWSKKCDADGHLDFYGLQALAVRGMFESGDGLVRRRTRRKSKEFPVPLQLQVLESDHLDVARTNYIGGNNRTVQGIEFDTDGRTRLAYWLYDSHPGHSFFDPMSSLQSVRVPARDVVHVFVKDRPQNRGAPWGAASMTSLHSLAGYEQSEVIRKRLEACLVGVITGGDADDPTGMAGVDTEGNPLEPGLYDATGARAESFAPGMFYNAVGGKDIKFSQPASTGGYDPYKTSMLHTIAAGFRVPHALLSGRLDKVNYSSSKVGIESFKVMMTSLQWQVIIPMLCEPIWEWFLDAAYMAGEIETRDHPAKWSPPKFYSADPGKDNAARLAEVRAGFTSLSAAIAETGEDPDVVLAQIAIDNAKLDALKIILDSDPRHMSQAGQTQQEPSDAEDTAAAGED